jgi:UDP-N-acetylmuramate dehydrogenase
VSDTIRTVRAFDRVEGRIRTLTAADCAFGYRDSALKSGCPDRYVVLAVTYRLRAGGPAKIAYADVERELERRGISSPALADVRDAVIAIRRAKSMVLDAGDPDSRSCGSFFLNPQVSPAALVEVEARVADPAMPRWPQPDGRVKLSAAWLIERAGFRRGMRDGPVGLSARHSLAIVAGDGARASDVIRLARRIQAAVQERCGVRLAPEPTMWGV